MFLFVHRFGRGPKYQGKLAKMQYQDVKHGRKAAKAAANRAQWAALTPQQRKTRLIIIGVIALVLLILMIAGAHGSKANASTLPETPVAGKVVKVPVRYQCFEYRGEVSLTFPGVGPGVKTEECTVKIAPVLPLYLAEAWITVTAPDGHRVLYRASYVRQEAPAR